MENNRNYHNNYVTTNREGANTGTYRHSAHATKKSISQIKDKIAMIMVFLLWSIRERGNLSRKVNIKRCSRRKPQRSCTCR